MEKDELTYHVPVLLKESVDGMNIRPDGTYVDVTFGKYRLGISMRPLLSGVTTSTSLTNCLKMS